MARVLIVYATREGQTLRIAERLAELLREDGHDVRLTPAAPFPALSGADGVVVAASVHLGRHPLALVRAVRAHRTVLHQLSSAFVSVCLSAAASDPLHRAEAEGYLRDFLQRTGWQPAVAASVAGALRFSRYGFVKTRLMLSMARRQRLGPGTASDCEFTDWSEVRRLAAAFSAQLETAPPRLQLPARAPHVR